MAISDKIDAFLEKSFPAADTAVYRDLSLNFKKIMEDSPLEPIDRFRNALAVGQTLHWKELTEMATAELKELGLDDAAIRECKESAAIMGMLNTYYKFKSYLSPEVMADPAFQRAGLRMNALSKPVNTKEKFEMMAFAVSVVNGCQTCVASHEKALSDLGVGRDKIHDLARLAAVTKGLSALA